MLDFIKRKYILNFIYLVFSSLLISCAQSGCPGGMCAPNHYYSSPKSIWSMGGSGSYKSKSKNKSGGRRVKSRYKKPKSVRSIEYNQRWNKPSRRLSANIEGGSFRTKKGKQGRVANIEGGSFRSGRSKTMSVDIEGGNFKTRKSKTYYSDIELSPFKIRRKAKRRTSKAQRAIKYKEPKDRKGKKSKYGLFDPEIEGWEKKDRPVKKRKHKEGKEGHGTKKID